jgi:hypothetical protein
MAEGEPKGDWTADELDLIIADYFAMLGAEIRRVSYDKTQHRRALMAQIDRSNGSIEFKHQNISAVLQQLDLPWINGYKPRAHFQESIVSAIERYILQYPMAQHPEALAGAFTERPQLFMEPPPLLEPKRERPEVIQRLVRKFNPAERDFINRKLGHDGEEMIFKFEQQRLRQADQTLQGKCAGYLERKVMAPATTFCLLTKKAANDFSKSRRPSAPRLLRFI